MKLELNLEPDQLDHLTVECLLYHHRYLKDQEWLLAEDKVYFDNVVNSIEDVLDYMGALEECYLTV